MYVRTNFTPEQWTISVLRTSFSKSCIVIAKLIALRCVVVAGRMACAARMSVAHARLMVAAMLQLLKRVSTM